MKASGLSGYALCVSIAVAVLAGCGGSQPPIGAPGAMPQSRVIANHAGRGGSWMLPGASGEDLLYVSTASGIVGVYDYKSRKRVGMLSGFQYPRGQCVDKVGNIWITDFDAENIVEYAHGGTSPIRTLYTTASPFGCSVDSNGNIAVTITPNGNVSDIALFKSGSSNATTYHDRRCDLAWTPGFDAHGNLYFEGIQYSRYSQKINVCELPAGGTTIRRVSFNHKITGLGSAMWDGEYVTLTDVTNTIKTYVYEAHEAPSGDLTRSATTELIDKCSRGYTEIRQPFIVGKKNTPINDKQGDAILGANWADACYSDFDGWAYPSGGKKVWSLNLRMADGESVSLAPHR